MKLLKSLPDSRTDLVFIDAHRYIKLLEVSNIIERVPAFSVNRGKRLVKSPKLFFIDPALAVFLSGCYDAATLGASGNWATISKPWSISTYAPSASP